VAVSGVQGPSERYPGMTLSKPRQRSANWSAKLTQSLTLKDGNKLVTLEDARRVVLAHLVTEIEYFDLTRAMELLLTAAETGSVADRKAATDHVVTVLTAA
jgi:hypothetical protein